MKAYEQNQQQSKLLRMLTGEIQAIDSDEQTFCCVVIANRKNTKDEDMDYLALAEADKKFESDISMLFASHPTSVLKTNHLERAIIISCKSIDEVLRLRDMISHNSSAHRNIHFAFSAPKPYANMADCYTQALRTKEPHFVVGDQNIFYYDKICDDTSSADSFVEIGENDLARLITSAKQSAIKEYFDEIGEEIAQKQVKSYIQMLMIVSNVHFKLMKLLSSKVNGCSCDYIPTELSYRSIISKSSYPAMIDGLCDLALEISDIIESSKNFPTMFEDAKQFMLKNYTDKTLTLRGVSEQTNARYLSAIFKQNTGKTFAEFLTDLRMQKAKELLTSSMSTPDVAQAVGYEDSTYFNTVFKSYFGKSPTDIKN